MLQATEFLLFPSRQAPSLFEPGL